jgi:dephospho-CoA kinase
MAMEYLMRRRDELKSKLSEQISAEEKIKYAAEIAQTDLEIKNIRSKF